MLKQKTNIRKTKSGNVIKEVKEVYLRRNIICGINKCEECSKIENLNQKAILKSKLYIESNLIDIPYIIIPSMEVVESQLDILEDSRIKNVVLCQTILENYKNKNRQQYQKLMNILTTPEKHFYQFLNEFHADIYIQKTTTETIKERNDRCLERTYLWYKNHIMRNFKTELKIVILTVTEEEAQVLRNNCELNVLSIRDYIGSLYGFEDLIDKINVGAFNDLSLNQEKFMYPAYLAQSELQVGIRNGKLLKGVFHVSSDNYKEASVIINEETSLNYENNKKILIHGILNMNRAFDGDVVVLETLPKEEWKNVSKRIEEDIGITITDDKNDELQDISNEPCGKIVGIIKRNWKNYCGTLQINEKNINGINYLFRPLNKSIPFINIETRRAKDLINKRICVAVDFWPKNNRYPLGHYLTTLGDLGDKNVETETILEEEGVRYQPFSKSVLKCLPNMDNEEEWNPDIFLSKQSFRKDLRHLNVCSIDPPGCTDIDDALHCRQLEISEYSHLFKKSKKIYELGVHIADVTQFVLPGTALDDEAYARGTTVYLTDRRIDMIPELLSSNLCSLRENVDRLAFSVLWYFDEDGNQIEEMPSKFCKSVIKSRRAFTYYEAQAILDDPNDNTVLGQSVKCLGKFARKLRQDRVKNGAISLASSEVRFEMDQERNEPLELQQKEQMEANRLVEDFMLLANISVANKIYEHFSECSVLRCHPSPMKGSFKPICELLKDKFNISELKLKHIEENLVALLDIVSDYKKDTYLNTLLRILSTRCLQQALYFCSGSRAKNDFYHFGLAESIYTHFTSPIRRYPDILVHRLLSASIGIVDENSIVLTGMPSDQIQIMCDHLNRRNRSARLASWSSLKLHTVLFVKKCPNGVIQEDAYILQLSENAIRVYIPRFGREGTIYLTPSPNRFNEKLTVDTKMTLNITLNDTLSLMTFNDYNIKIEKLERVVIQMAVKTLEACHMDSLIYMLVKPNIPGISVPSLN